MVATLHVPAPAYGIEWKYDDTNHLYWSRGFSRPKGKNFLKKSRFFFCYWHKCQ